MTTVPPPVREPAWPLSRSAIGLWVTEGVITSVFLGVVDLAWPEARVVVEYEGAYHFDGLQIVKDDARYAALTAAGWHVIRVLAADLRDLDSLVSRIASALEVAAG